jgi:hypothetical protein
LSEVIERRRVKRIAQLIDLLRCATDRHYNDVAVGKVARASITALQETIELLDDATVIRTEQEYRHALNKMKILVRADAAHPRVKLLAALIERYERGRAALVQNARPRR